MTDKPAESAVERYEAEYRSWAELHGNGTPSTATWTNIVLETIRRADAAIAALTEALSMSEAALAKMNARHCLHCAMAYVDCPRSIELLDGGGPMDIECCSEWTPKEDEA